ncbi:IS66 family transposase [Heliorestis convoluta]|uniref:Transposase IS66 n=1 Tax=Heliorestis convoluta TaxID=356322 RepID=A0A5Q2N404_9FIRM|nr:IS66 family transposase [Heliorestis convoluta]QGG48326.1 Transposase IS66 [Heliorestis convoluta]
MSNSIDNTESIEYLQNRCKQLEQQNAELMAQLNWLKEQIQLNRHRQYGSSSERTVPGQQELLFNETELEALAPLVEPPIENIEVQPHQRRKKRGSRVVNIEGLPVETIEYRLPEEEKHCACCGGALHEMSTEERQELKIIPAQVKVVKHVRYVYSCRCCEKDAPDADKPLVITAPMPAPVLQKSFVSPSVMAYVMTQKYAYGMPLYRQEQHFLHLGVNLSRQNLANWVLYGANRWLSLLYDRMHHHLLQQKYLYCDETSLQVLHEPGRKAQTNSYMWLYRTGPVGPPIVLFDYQETRAGEHPKKFLSDFRGFLHVDGYSGYHLVENVRLCGCWAHARRKFNEALKALPNQKSSKPVVAQQGLEYCNQLFAIEGDLKEAEVDAKTRYKERLERSKPVLDAFLAWLHTQETKVLPKSSFGQAITYCLNQWEKLEGFLLDGNLEIDNNRSERSLKPFVVGRKNWMFSNTPSGARASAIVYSIIETAKENGLNPFTYLIYLFEQLPNIDTEDEQVLDQLLPWSKESLPNSCLATK